MVIFIIFPIQDWKISLLSPRARCLSQKKGLKLYDFYDVTSGIDVCEYCRPAGYKDRKTALYSVSVYCNFPADPVGFPPRWPDSILGPASGLTRALRHVSSACPPIFGSPGAVKRGQ